MGFLEGATNYWWNWGLYQRAYMKTYQCFFMSIWGLFFDNDNGYMLNRCMQVVGGSEVIFPV